MSKTRSRTMQQAAMTAPHGKYLMIRPRYSTQYTTQYRKIYEIQYKKCLECEQGMYGANCSKKCKCDMNNTVSCDHHDGTCRCKPGWIGTTCNQTCSEGWHGDNCEERCICVENTTIHCDEQNGTCYCAQGWWGSDCSEWVEDITGILNTTKITRAEGEVANSMLLQVMVPGISILTLFIAVIVIAVCMMRRYRKRRTMAKEDHISNDLNSGHGAQDQVHSGGEYDPRPANNHDKPTSDRRNEGEAVESHYTDLQDIRDGLYTGLRRPNEAEYSEVESPYKSLEQVNAGFYMGLRKANVQNESGDHP
ncbi:multiple epidermal growth factor-like domains protein 11 [Ptychodera flava]|uniref:multiple epidermal growth factor-like domains protein 11 n=1 Tax=Ptychodera flava TaxID=63121 RepID=UPI00396AA103